MVPPSHRLEEMNAKAEKASPVPHPASYPPVWNPTECPLSIGDTPQDFTTCAIYHEHQDDLNALPVAEAIVNRRSRDQALRAVSARNASGRRRFVDPTTCDKEYTAAEMEFMQAMQLYKQASGRMFPTWCEVLEILKGLGYEKGTVG
jgi:hypothetical protein